MHLKEYSAEIESLRSQLQASREKNGVYLDPKDFYEMENKIASLGMQLVECESVLKCRNEEAILLRESNEHMETKIQHLSAALDTANYELSKTRLELDTTKLQLEETLVELKATESVVIEQSKTEQSLTAEALDLQNEVQDCRKKIQSLHGKIELYTAGEAAGESRAKSFVADLLTARSSLLTSVEDLGHKGTESLALIGAEIQSLLSAGRSTCHDLKSSVGLALEVLLGDADRSQNELESGLSRLSNQLSHGSTVAISQLSEIKARLESTIDRINELAQQSRTIHDAEQKKVTTMVDNIQTDVKTLTCMTHAFVLRQEQVLNQQMEQSNESTATLKEKLRSYSHAFQLQQREQETWFELQSEKVQQV